MTKPFYEIIKELEELLEEHTLLFRRNSKTIEGFELGYHRGYTTAMQLIIAKVKNYNK
jgi:hypothetical protein